MKHRIFITGEKGMMAKSLVSLLDKDHDIVWPCKNYSLRCRFKSMYNDGWELDICDEKTIESVVNEVEPTIILHTAGVVGTDLCNMYPDQARKSNIQGSYIIGQISRKYNIKIVYFSTTAIYDPKFYGIDSPICEDSVKNPSTLYGVTKYAGELLLKTIISPENLLVIRPCFIFGRKDDNHSAVVKIIKSVLFGGSYDILLNPSFVKDYLFIDDEMEAIKMLIDMNMSGDYNVSRGSYRSFSEYVSEIEQILDRKAKLNFFPDFDYLHNHVVNNNKIRSIGWEPKLNFGECVKIIHDEFLR